MPFPSRFRPGERFFIQSVQHYRERISDSLLLDQVKRFVHQEAMHMKEHARCNKALLESFPEGRTIEDLTAQSLGLIRRFTPKGTQLATTCALEHHPRPLRVLRTGDPGAIVWAIGLRVINLQIVAAHLFMLI